MAERDEVWQEIARDYSAEVHMMTVKEKNQIRREANDMDEAAIRQIRPRHEQQVVCAANRFPDGTVLLGARHWDKWMCDMANRLGIKGGTEEQGFINQFGEFLTREEAMEVVRRNKQPFDVRRNGGDSKTLFSEGIY